MTRALWAALGFLTRIPVPQVPIRERDLARGAALFAWVGWLLAGLLWAVAELSAPAGQRLGALAVISVWVLVTGALHLDGLADTSDGLGGGRGDRARTLDIMRDSRIGTHGAVALVLVLALKWAALERCLALGDRSWLVAPVLARLLCTVQLAVFPYARGEGLGTSFRGRVGLGSSLLGACALLPALALAGPALSWVVAAGAAVSLGFALRVQRRIGGLTGDVYGAGIELSEAAALIAAALHLP